MSLPPISTVNETFMATSSEDEGKAQAFFSRVIELGIAFKSSGRVFPKEENVSRSQISFDCMPGSGLSHEQLIQQFQSIAMKSSNWGSPNFLGFPDAANNIAGLAAALLIPLLNQNMANQEICSPEATFVEMEVIHWLREILGYPVSETYTRASEIGGVLTLGGCLSNTIALLAAREKCFPGSGLRGIPVLPSKIRVLVPNIIEHYSIRSAMAWISLGEQNVVRVPVDAEFRMDQEALKRIIDHERDIGNNILACVAYAGDSRSMQIDDLDALSRILDEKDIWFHVDACHGSQLAFSEQHSHKLRGIEKADSITIDPHKTMLIPYNCSFVLFRRPSTQIALSTHSDLILNTQWSLGKISPFIGSKAFDALKIWSTIKYFGKKQLGQLIDERLELTNAIQLDVMRRQNLVLLNKTDINSCMMVFIPANVQKYCLDNSIRLSDADLEKINNLNLCIKDTIRQDGTYYIHGFPLQSCPNEYFVEPDKPLFVLRTLNGNPLSTMSNVKGLLDRIEKLGGTFFKESAYACMGDSPSPSRLQRAEERLNQSFPAILGNRDFVAVLYGSSALPNNAILSDIDLMIFTHGHETSLLQEVVSTFRSIMDEEGIFIDSEVPLHRKLPVTFEFATQAAEAGPPLDEAGHVVSICKTPEYLASDQMLQRLIFNVFTTPNRIIAAAGSGIGLFKSLETKAAEKLVIVISDLGQPQVNTVNEFVKLAISDGIRSGEQYLGYKSRSEVTEKLSRIFQGVRSFLHE